MIRVTASPNIAFIKYWGKRESTSDETRNIGLNTSVSMTLSHAQTKVQIEKLNGGMAHQIFVDKNPASPADRAKIETHIKRIERHFETEYPLGSGLLKIESENNFPSSAGIASSASAFAALTIGICAAIIGKERTRDLMENNSALLSMLARRGSGSASRSVCGGFMKWDGEHAESLASKWNLLDTIVILSRKAKSISSSDGHALALTSPHFNERLEDLPSRTSALLAAIDARDIHTLGALLETEALEMHQIAETSSPPVHYLGSESRRLIAAIQALRERQFYFTIDAGPNLHFISEKPIVADLERVLAGLNLQAEIWQDGLGTGPSLE